MARTYSVVLGLMAFTVIVARGAVGDADLAPTLVSALGHLTAFAAVGGLVGQLAADTLHESGRQQLPSESSIAGGYGNRRDQR